MRGPRRKDNVDVEVISSGFVCSPWRWRRHHVEVQGPGGEEYAVWPAEVLERVHFIVGKTREGLAVGEIAAIVEARWRRR